MQNKIDFMKKNPYIFCNKCFSFILNIVSIKLQHRNENRLIAFDAFKLQEIKRAVFLHFDKFNYLILAYNIVKFVIRHYIWQISHINSNSSPYLSMKTEHNTNSMNLISCNIN